MSHPTQESNVAEIRHPKVMISQYLLNDDEPSLTASHLPRFETDTELLENSYVMRQRLRRTAQQIRSSYI
jgi:hypothetical protein